VESHAWAVFDPAAGRIVKQRSPPSSSTTAAAAAAEEEEEEEEEGEGAGEDEEKGRLRASARVAKAQTSWSSLAAPRKPAVKGGKERFSFVCSNCKEADSQWWGFCRHCNAAGTMERYVLGTDGNASAEGSHHIARSWIPQKSKEIVPQSLQEVNKGVNQAEWRIPL
jgi:DNA repair protein RadA/Sms